MATGRGRESTLTGTHICHRPRIPFGHVLIELRCLKKHYKREQQKSTVSKPQEQKKCVRSVIRRNSSCRTCRFKIHHSGKRGHTEGKKSTLTLIHSCHRPRIPFRHVLIELLCMFKHCKREGATKKRKINPPHKQQKGYTVLNTQKQN